MKYPSLYLNNLKIVEHKIHIFFPSEIFIFPPNLPAVGFCSPGWPHHSPRLAAPLSTVQYVALLKNVY